MYECKCPCWSKELRQPMLDNLSSAAFLLVAQLCLCRVCCHQCLCPYIIINIGKAPWGPSPQHFTNATLQSRALSWRAVWISGAQYFLCLDSMAQQNEEDSHVPVWEEKAWTGHSQSGVLFIPLICLLCFNLFYRCNWILKQDWIFMPESVCYTFILK